MGFCNLGLDAYIMLSLYGLSPPIFGGKEGKVHGHFTRFAGRLAYEIHVFIMIFSFRYWISVLFT